jgi:hypothetical protein
MSENNHAKDFLLEEYRILRSKSQETTHRIDELERNVIVACSAIFVFSVGTFKTEHKWQSLILFILPLCVSIVGFLRYSGLVHKAKEADDYTVLIEKKLAGSDGGWLTYYYSQDRPRSDEQYQRNRDLIWWAIMLFNVIAGLALVVPLFFLDKHDVLQD